MNQYQEQLLRDVVDGMNTFKAEFSTELKKIDRRISTLEAEGIPEFALQQLKRIDSRIEEHIKDEKSRLDKVDDQFRGQAQLISQIANNTTITSNVLSQMQADMVKAGRDAGAKSGLAVSAVAPVVAGVVYAFLQFFNG